MVFNTPTLEVLAEEFEKHDGLRPLVIATGMHDQSPIDDLNHYFEVIDRRLGPEGLMKGVQTDPDLYPLIEACLEAGLVVVDF
jgi:hypothetical protein